VPTRIAGSGDFSVAKKFQLHLRDASAQQNFTSRIDLGARLGGALRV
jgi:hypothetical protein